MDYDTIASFLPVLQSGETTGPAEVVLVSRKGKDDPVRWVYLDIGKFGGLAETMDESIRYPIRTGHDEDRRTGREHDETGHPGPEHPADEQEPPAAHPVRQPPEDHPHHDTRRAPQRQQ